MELFKVERDASFYKSSVQLKLLSELDRFLAIFIFNICKRQHMFKLRRFAQMSFQKLEPWCQNGAASPFHLEKRLISHLSQCGIVQSYCKHY